MKRATCIRGALLMVLLALTSFASIPPQASAFPPSHDCSDPSYPVTCCRCVNRCARLYDNCLAAATTPAQEGACFAEWLACDDGCFNGLACGNGP